MHCDMTEQGVWFHGSGWRSNVTRFSSELSDGVLQVCGVEGRVGEGKAGIF